MTSMANHHHRLLNAVGSMVINGSQAKSQAAFWPFSGPFGNSQSICLPLKSFIDVNVTTDGQNSIVWTTVPAQEKRF